MKPKEETTKVGEKEKNAYKPKQGEEGGWKGQIEKNG